MSDHNIMHRPTETADDQAKGAFPWRAIVKSRFFAIGVTAAALLLGLLLLGRLGVASRTISAIGLVALMMGGHFFMHRGHGSHGGHDARRGHGGGGMTSERLDDAGETEPGNEEKDQPYEPRSQTGCH